MCGITGFMDFSRQVGADDLLWTARRMSDTLIHRGPDDSGTWADAEAGIALGHRRLSIVDLSPEGRQPMLSTSGRYVVVFNGEIYNYRDIRRELDGHFAGDSIRWRGRSDTEVMLAAFETWGLEDAVRRFAGMFAFALWDRRERLLHLVRDRLGEKPLYYGRMGKTFLFGSELKALRAHSGFRNEINRDALALYMRHNCIPAPHSIYRGVSKLLPGTILTINGFVENGQRPVPKPYWQAGEIAEAGLADPYRGTETEAVNHLDTLLREVISRQMVADVPLGAFLSGGVDSSTIVALMQAQSGKPVKTFTIGFAESRFDEAAYARDVASHLGTDHTALYVTARQALEVIPELATLYDEPFADSSQIPTYLVSAMTRNSVTVSLSGDGGDELFGGYNRYCRGSGIWKKLRVFPRRTRRSAANMLSAVSPAIWDKLYLNAAKVLPVKFRQRLPGDKIHKLAEIMTVESLEEMYFSLVSHWKDPASVVKHAGEPPTIIAGIGNGPDIDDFTLKMMYLDLVSYLPDDILVKVDRAGMGVGLETRMPFLDHRIVEFGWRIPLSMKIRNGRGKWLLRQVLYKYVPRKLMERPKMGFGVPIDNWLRGPLRGWAEELLDERRLRCEGFFNTGPIRDKWEEHLTGKRNWQYHLWDVLMFQAWMERQDI
jgi:asparagine synthase (glutamine-hydrolysing)